jgi:hypothetical protein
MTELPAGYPHRLSDDEILQVLAELADDIFRAAADINVTLQLGPLVTAGQNELNARIARRAIKASDRTARRLIFLTWLLVVLTVVLTGATVALLVKA